MITSPKGSDMTISWYLTVSIILAPSMGSNLEIMVLLPVHFIRDQESQRYDFFFFFDGLLFETCLKHSVH